MQNVTQDLQSSREELRAAEGEKKMAEARVEVQEKALVANLDALRAERDKMAEAVARLEKQKERPAGVDSTGDLQQRQPVERLRSSRSRVPLSRQMM